MRFWKKGGLRMKTEVTIIPAVIAAVIYLSGLFMLSLYIAESLSMAPLEAYFNAQELEMPF